MSEIDSFIWTEKYRPQNLDDCILPDSVKSQMRGFIESGEIPHLILAGSAGTGKTTLARCLSNEIGADL